MTNRPFALLALCAIVVAGCAAETDSADDGEDVGADEAALGYTDSSTIQVYDSNTKHMSEPGKPSFENSDFTQLLHYMDVQKAIPDIITLQEVGTKASSFTSQPCEVFVAALERIVKPKGARTAWHCIVADGATSSLGNASGGAAIVYRGRFKPIGAKQQVGLFYWNGKSCTHQQAPGWTAVVQKFQDGAHTVAVASVHLPVASNGNGTTGDDCSGRNLEIVEQALASTKADVKIIAGDMNHGDATRHLDAAGAVVQDWWETSYAKSNDFLNAEYPSTSKYRDAFFRDCAAGANPSPTTAYSRAQTEAIAKCLVTKDWTFGRAGKLDARIDWLLVAGAGSLSDAKTIPFEDAYHAFLASTGKASAPVNHYSDHRALMLRVKY